MSLQEKFQITVPPNANANEDVGENQWQTFPFVKSSARSTGEAGFQHSNNVRGDAECYTKTNYLPPGMEIDNQARKRIENMPLSMAGATDVCNCVTDSAFEHGFVRHEMKGTDDQYSGEHMDHFYGVAVGQDDTGQTYDGFIERNNYLDRE